MVAAAEPVLMEPREIKQGARVLARAFHDDPGVAWILPRERSRRPLLRWNFEVFLRYGHRFGEAYCTTETLEAAAIWLPPSEPHFSLRRLAQLGYLGAVFKLDPWALIRSVAMMARLEGLHKRDVPGPALVPGCPRRPPAAPGARCWRLDHPAGVEPGRC